MKIILNSPKVLNQAIDPSVTVSEVNVTRIADIYQEKRIVCFIAESFKPLVLWKAATYDAIGQWSDTDVETRVKEIIDSM